MRRLSPFRQAASQFLLILVGLFVLIPLVGMVRLAFDVKLSGAPTEFRLIPEQIGLDVFRRVWETPSQSLSFLGLLRNSLIVSVGAALASIALGSSMAYAFARFHFRGRKAGLFGLLVGTLLPPVALMTPLYILLSIIGIRTSLLGLILVYTSFSMPFCIWNMRAAFQSVSQDLEEAAALDGASAWTTFTRITLPLALPAISVAALVAFLAGYSEFAIGWLFIEKSSNVTLAMALWGARTMGLTPWSELAALALLMSIPVILIFIFLQRYFLDRFLLISTVEKD